MATLSTEAVNALPPACRDARGNHMDARRAVRRWESYLLIAGGLLVILLVAAVVLTLIGQSAAAVIAMLTSIADSAALAWLVSRRADAEKHLRYWYGKVHAACPAEAVEEQEAISQELPLLLGS